MNTHLEAFHPLEWWARFRDFARHLYITNGRWYNEGRGRVGTMTIHFLYLNGVRPISADSGNEADTRFCRRVDFVIDWIRHTYEQLRAIASNCEQTGTRCGSIEIHDL